MVVSDVHGEGCDSCVLWQLRQLPAHVGSISCQVLQRGQRTEIEADEEITSGIWHFVQVGPVFLSIRLVLPGLRLGRLGGVNGDAFS